MSLDLVWYGIVGFNVPRDTVCPLTWPKICDTRDPVIVIVMMMMMMMIVEFI